MSSMTVIPALDLIDGAVVRLNQGDYERQKSYPIVPEQQLAMYVKQGATLLHLVDLTGAKNPKNRQVALIEHLVRRTQCDIQVGGGIRDESEVKALLLAGAKRVVIGSKAVSEPLVVKGWFDKYGADKFVLALDVRIKAGQNWVAIKGWQQTSALTLEQLIEDYSQVGLQWVLCTDIACDGTLAGCNVALYETLCQQFGHINIQASGGIGSLTDLQRLKNSGVFGVIVGRALLENRFDLQTALATVS